MGHNELFLSIPIEMFSLYNALHRATVLNTDFYYCSLPCASCCVFYQKMFIIHMKTKSK